jgi:fibronectin type 3 domain-containing protein
MDAWTLFSGLRDIEGWPAEPMDLEASLARGRRALGAGLRTAWMTTMLVASVLLVSGLGARALVQASPGPAPVPDVNPPQTPQDVIAVAVSPELVNVSWSAAADDVGVVGYTVLRDGEQVDTVDGSTLAYADAELQPQTDYRYAIDAFDEAGNHSELSRTVRVTTLRRDDVEPPTVPTDLTAEATGPNQVVLVWDPSSDDTAVAGYSIYRDGAELEPGVDGLTVTYTDVDVQPSTTYSYTVRAFDADGNTSPLSTAAEVTTPPPDDTTPPSAPPRVSLEQVEDGLEIRWEPAVDDVGVVGYRVLRNGSEIGTTDGSELSFVDMDDLCEGTHTYEVIAFDAAGNPSPPGSAETTVVC